MVNKIQHLAPIVLFVYNRPHHTLQTLEALAKNELAKDSILYIFADGPRANESEDVLDKIKETRQILREQQWCGNVNIIESNQNKGLATSITEGVSNIIKKYGKIIVLEDDIVTSPFFLDYMNDALHVYEKEKKVMHISSYLPPKGKNIKLPETFLLQFMSCWGWATWIDRWEMFIDDIEYLYKAIPESDNFKSFNGTGLAEPNMFDQIRKNNNGELYTWAIKWYSTIFLNQGLCLYPHSSIVKNIGCDGTGVNSGIAPETQNGPLFAKKITVKLISPIHESKKGKKYLIAAYQRIIDIKNNNYYFLDKQRNKYPKTINYLFRIYNFFIKKHK